MAFQAKYAGVCCECSGPVQVGESVTYLGPDGLVHVRCPKVEVCGTCFMQKSVAGVCGCD